MGGRLKKENARNTNAPDVERDIKVLKELFIGRNMI